MRHFRLHPPSPLDPAWTRITSLSFTLLFIYLSDAILSFWVPSLIQSAVHSPLIMGLIFSSSSVVGLIADLTLPQIINHITVSKLVLLSIIASVFFIALLYTASHFPHLIIFILAMAVWGIYYELLNFARQQFIADSVPLRLHTGASAVLSSFKSLAYFLGPILAGLLIFKGTLALSSTTLLLTLIGALLLTFTLRHHHRPMSIDVHHVNFLSELQHWQTLLKHVWPIVTLSLLVGIIDATFWTTGTVLTQQLSKHHLLGGLFLPLYTLPSLLVGFGLARLHLFQGKKKIALICTLLSGLSLTFIGITHHLALILIAVFISGILLAVSYPLIDAVYADIVSRMGRNRQHLIGLSSSSMSLAYIIGPILSGAIASLLGESTTFSIIGIITMIISATLLLLTPKKLKLPQTQISTWA